MNRDKFLPSKRSQMYVVSFGFLCFLIIFHLIIPMLLKEAGHSSWINSGPALILSSVLAVSAAALILFAFHVSIDKGDKKWKSVSSTSVAWTISFFLCCFILDVGATGFNTFFRIPLTSLMKWLLDTISTTEMASAPELSMGDMVVLLYLVLFAPVLEELAFRGLFYGALRKYGRWLAIIASALMFGFMHMNVYQFIGAFLSGIIYAILRDRAGLLMSIALHILTNCLNVIAVPLLLESQLYSSVYYIVLLGAMFFSVVMVALCFSKKNPHRNRNIAYLELDVCKMNWRMVLGNPVLSFDFIMCIMIIVY